MKLFIKKTGNLIIPTKANKLDACYDLTAVTDPIIVAEKEDIIAPQPLEEKPTYYRKIKYIEYGTGLYVTPEDIKWYLHIFPRSSFSKYQLVLANHVPAIDTGYVGEISLRYHYIFAPKDLRIDDSNGYPEIIGRINPEFIYKKGDKIAQMKPFENVEMEFKVVDELPKLDTRGEGKFGSSGK